MRDTRARLELGLEQASTRCKRKVRRFARAKTERAAGAAVSLKLVLKKHRRICARVLNIESVNGAQRAG